MHLLCTSVVAFILLPLAFSCESTKPKENISLDYQHIILKQLDDIKSNIEKNLNKSCKITPHNTTHHLQNATGFIHKVSCKLMSKGFKGELADKVKNLVNTIHSSLGCQCFTKQGQRFVRNLCPLKNSLAKIQKAYERYNSV